MSLVAAPLCQCRLWPRDPTMTSHVTALNCVSLNRKRGWTTISWPPRWLGHNKLTTRHTYSKEDCGHNDPSMSPGSRSGRGAMTLTPAPNGAKESNITHRTSETDASPKRRRAGLSCQRKNDPSSARGIKHSAQALKNRRSAPRPSGPCLSLYGS